MDQQPSTFFDGKYNDFTVSLQFTADGRSLKIYTESFSPPQEHSQTIDAAFIAQRPNFHFKTPTEVMQFCRGHFDCVMVNAQGIRINVSRAYQDGKGVIVEIPTNKSILEKTDIAMKYIFKFDRDLKALHQQQKADL